MDKIFLRELFESFGMWIKVRDFGGEIKFGRSYYYEMSFFFKEGFVLMLDFCYNLGNLKL